VVDRDAPVERSYGVKRVSAPRTEGLVPAMLVQPVDARSGAAELRQGAMLPPLTSPPGLERMD